MAGTPFWTPELVLGLRLGPPTSSYEGFGGLPWGLPADRWPSCSDCQKPLTLLAQLDHHHERLDLGGEGRRLYVFQCNHDPGVCENWEFSSGSSVALILRPEELVNEQARPPAPGAEVEADARVVGWERREDPVAPERFAELFEDATYSGAIDGGLRALYAGTKLGGAPLWLQSAAEGPGAPMRFVAQLAEQLLFKDAPPSAAELGVAVTVERGRAFETEAPPAGKSAPEGGPRSAFVCADGVWSIEAGNYGGGIAYVYVDRDSGQAGIFWQC